MKKILVTTDFSANSASGLRFAAQLAHQMPVELTFFYVQHLIRPTSWGDVTFDEYKEEQTEKSLTELQAFVANFYQTEGYTLGQAAYAIDDNLSTETAIREYASQHHFDYICISTRGAGTVKKIMGTTTSALIKNAEVPIISIPSEYKATPINHVLYAADLKHLDKELQKVVDFAKPIEAKVELLHFSSLSENLEAEDLQKKIQQISDYAVEVHVESPDYVKSLVKNIKVAIENSNTSLLVMFTEQHRSFFEKIFLSSKAADYAFNADVPLLTFKK